MVGQPQHRLIAEIDAGPVGNVVEHDRMRRAIGERVEVQLQVRVAMAANNRGRRSDSHRSAMPPFSSSVFDSIVVCAAADRPRQTGKIVGLPIFVAHRDTPAASVSPGSRVMPSPVVAGEDQAVDRRRTHSAAPAAAAMLRRVRRRETA